MTTQVRDPISTDNGIEMHDMSSLKSGEEMNDSDHLIEIAETGFTETRSGHRCEKFLKLRNSEGVVLGNVEKCCNF